MSLDPGERERLAGVLRDALDDHGLDYEEPAPGSVVVRLPGTHKLATVTRFTVGDHALHVEAFFCRKPEENREAFWRWLLERNQRMYAVSFAVDNVGDVYLVGRLPLAAVDADELDRLLGSVLSYADEWFDVALELGFRGSIEREWDWRVRRGESLANLAAFARFADPANRRAVASEAPGGTPGRRAEEADGDDGAPRLAGGNG